MFPILEPNNYYHITEKPLELRREITKQFFSLPNGLWVAAGDSWHEQIKAPIKKYYAYQVTFDKSSAIQSPIDERMFCIVDTNDIKIKQVPLIDYQSLLFVNQNQYRAHKQVHGSQHWLKVAENALAIANKTKANRDFILLFALLHDSKRNDDGADSQHGQRAANYLEQLANEKKFGIESFKELEPELFNKLLIALRDHDKGQTSKDINIGTAWDSDRWELTRVGRTVDKKYLSFPFIQMAKKIELVEIREPVLIPEVKPKKKCKCK